MSKWGTVDRTPSDLYVKPAGHVKFHLDGSSAKVGLLCIKTGEIEYEITGLNVDGRWTVKRIM